MYHQQHAAHAAHTATVTKARLRTGAWLLAACLSVISHHAHAGAIEELQHFNTSYRTASGNFTQTIQGQSRKTSTGQFIFARPGKFRWNYNTPSEQILVSDGKILSLYDKDLKQVTRRPLSSAIGSSPAAVLFGTGDLSKSFKLEDAGERDGRNWVYATPKTKSSFSSVNIGMRNGIPEAIVLFDNFGQTTILQLSNLQKNPSIPAGTFTFTPPSGTRISQ